MPFPIECPPPTTCEPCEQTEYDFVMELAADSLPGDTVVGQIRAGIQNEPGGGLCTVLLARTIREDAVSEWAEIAQPEPNCVPVPEPDLAIGLGLGLLTLLRRGRRYRRGSRSSRSH